MNKVSKIIWSLFSSAMCLVYKNDAGAYNIPTNSPCTVYYGTTCGNGTTSNPYTNGHVDYTVNCASTQTKCYYTIAGNYFSVTECAACKSGYTEVTDNTYPIGDHSCVSAGTQFYKTTCVCKCSNCTDSGTWTAKGTGYQQRTGKGCVCSSGTATCTTTTHYRCADGYYGTTSNGTSGCTKCPTPGTSKAGSESVSDCYIPGGESYSDTYGKYAYNCDCKYNGTDSCGSSSSSAA